MVLLALLQVLPVVAQTVPPLPAFPAQGHGAAATGGRGGAVFIVHTLADHAPRTTYAGATTFREALETSLPTGQGRTIVFRKGGVIRALADLEGSYILT